MAELNLNGVQFGQNLLEVMTLGEIRPGDQTSYQACKTLFESHPLGGKLADTPLNIAQSQKRKISVPKGPEDRLVEAFEREWKAIEADRYIFNLCRLARVYGLASLALVDEGSPPAEPLKFEGLAEASIGFTVADPLNTSGSLLLSQDPNSILFQKVRSISIAGVPYHRSRTVVLQNEDPIYLTFQSSTFAYSGRSVYQRALVPLISFLHCLQTDDLIALKAGVLIEKQQQNSSAVDQLMMGAAQQKREFVKQARVGNVITIGIEEAIESLNLQNLDGAYGMARKNIIENIASASGTPAKLLLNETFAAGFGEGAEDTKHIAQYVDRIRTWMEPAYAYFDKIVRHRAWNEPFYKALQVDFPEYKGVDFNEFFYDASNSFEAQWPSLIEEPPSEKIKVDDVKLKAVIAWVEVMSPMMDPMNKATLVQWACDTLNSMPDLFTSPLDIDLEAMADFAQEQADKQQAMQEQSPAPPFSARDALMDAVARLPVRDRARA